jgi:hypothetical protein
VGAAATLAIPVGMHFTPAAGQLPATWVLTVTVQDDRGNRPRATISVAVQ